MHGNPGRVFEPKRNITTTPDLFIAGGGPAGLSCAIAAATRGFSVEVVDAMEPPIDKACGEGLMPDSLAALSKLGVDTNEVQNAPLHGIRFLGEAASTEANFLAGTGRGLRRNLLHQLLLDRAIALGVGFRWQTVVQKVEDGVVSTNRHWLRPRWIVGADGSQSRVRKAAGLDAGTIASQRIGLQQHFTLDLWTNHVEIYWSDHGQAYVTPVSATEVCVIFLGRRRFAGLEETLARYPALAHRLKNTVRTGPTRGAFTANRYLKHVTARNIALIGDASGSVDAVTGEGLALCFRQAVALAEAMQANDLDRYEVAHRAIRRLPAFMSRTMLLMDRSSLVREQSLRVLSSRPQLFQHLLGVHLGEQPIHLLGSRGVIATGLRILTGPLFG